MFVRVLLNNALNVTEDLAAICPPGDIQNTSSDTDSMSAQEQVKSPLHNNSLVLDRDLEPEIYSTQSQHYLREQEVQRTRCYKGHFCGATVCFPVQQRGGRG